VRSGPRCGWWGPRCRCGSCSAPKFRSGPTPLTDLRPLLKMPALVGVDLAGSDGNRLAGIGDLPDRASTSAVSPNAPTATPGVGMSDRAARGPVWPDVVMVLAVLGWLGVPPVLTYGGFIVGAPFFGELPTAADQALSARLWTGAVAALVAFPALGLWCAARQRRRGAVVLFSLGVAAGLLVSAVVITLSVHGRPETPAPRAPWACQELSGGDNRCPGG